MTPKLESSSCRHPQTQGDNLEQPALIRHHLVSALLMHQLVLAPWCAGRAECSKLGQKNIDLKAFSLFAFRDSWVLFCYSVGKHHI